MQTDGGWVSISEASRLYGRHRKWVSDQIERYNIETRKQGNQKQLRLTDLIAHRGEPQGDVTARNANHTENPQIIADASAQEAQLLRQENQMLRERVEEMKQRQAWLEGLVDRYTAQLPAPERRGWAARLRTWWRNA